MINGKQRFFFNRIHLSTARELNQPRVWPAPTQIRTARRLLFALSASALRSPLSVKSFTVYCARHRVSVRRAGIFENEGAVRGFAFDREGDFVAFHFSFHRRIPAASRQRALQRGAVLLQRERLLVRAARSFN